MKKMMMICKLNLLMIMKKMNNNLNKLLIIRGILESNQKKYYHNGHKIKIWNISHNNLMCNH